VDGYHLAPLRAYLDGLDPSSIDQDLALRVERARSQGHPTFWFKRSRPWPRTQAALASLSGLWPDSVLDVGSGRGTSLWPMLEGLPLARVTALECDRAAARELGRVVAGGLPRLAVVCAEIGRLPFSGGAFQVACALEVLEHLSDPIGAARELRRVARHALVASVPLGPDDNPEHRTVFERGALASLLRSAGFAKVKERIVDGHLLGLALVE